MLGGSLWGFLLGSRWYSSSVTKGMRGDRRRRPTSRQVYRVCLQTSARLLLLPSSSALVNTGLTLSWGRGEGGDGGGVRFVQELFLVTAVVALQASYQVDVTQLVQPEVVNGRGEAGEVVALERSVAESDGGAQSRQDPPVGDALLATQLTTQVENIVLLARVLSLHPRVCMFMDGRYL